MDTTPLVIDEIEAGKAFIEQMNRYAPVKAALWLKSAEDGKRYLYLALEGLTPETTDQAYREVSRISNEMEDHYIHPFQVKVIGTSDRIARAIADFYDQYPYSGPHCLDQKTPRHPI